MDKGGGAPAFFFRCRPWLQNIIYAIPQHLKAHKLPYICPYDLGMAFFLKIFFFFLPSAPLFRQIIPCQSLTFRS